jgi:hypothetical protein
MSDPVVMEAPATKAPTPEQIRAEFDLPFSGKHVIVLRGTGRDMRQGLLASGEKADKFKMIYGIASRLCLVDGKKLRVEDYDNLDFDDCMKIVEEVGGLLNPTKKATVKEPAPETEEDDTLQ